MTDPEDFLIYSDNGVEIDFLIRDSIITTDRYSIYWNVDGELVIDVANDLATYGIETLLSINKPYDLSLIADIDETNGNKPPKIIYSSADMVNKRVESLLKLKAFL